MRRRDFLRLASGGLLAACTEPLFAQTLPDFWSQPRSIWMKTQDRQRRWEEVSVVYFADGQIQQSGYQALCHLMRDMREDKVFAMSTTMLDILYGMQHWFAIHDQHRPLILDSGFRTPRTNKIVGGKEESMHLVGGAADIYLPDVPVAYMGELALRLRGGGVGFYPGDGFVHVDNGQIRTWVDHGHRKAKSV
jgi:uncharacterized protein YcbK (DUF882 family)